MGELIRPAAPTPTTTVVEMKPLRHEKKTWSNRESWKTEGNSRKKLAWKKYSKKSKIQGENFSRKFASEESF